MFKTVFMLMILIFLSAPQAQCFELLKPDYIGVDIWVSKECSFIGRMESEENDYEWQSIALKFGKYLPNRKYRVNLEPAIGLHKSYGDSTRCGTSIELKLWLLRDFEIPYTLAKLYLGVGVGLLHISPNHNQPEIGNSGLLGSLAGRIGFRKPFLEKHFFIIEGRIDHISDVLKKCDGGRNYCGLVVGIGKEF